MTAMARHNDIQTTTEGPPRDRARLHLAVRGAVQGVGFRPFAFRLAADLGLDGWVNNSPHGAAVEVEGPPPHLKRFLVRLQAELPPPGQIHGLEAAFLEAVGHRGFEIRPSRSQGAPTALVLPDIATCPACLEELFDPADRRCGYPFINCTHCGPRFSIIEALPYDRARTTMRRFPLCPACQAEYDDPLDRRFHAQPNACPDCGPQLSLWDPAGRPLAQRQDALHKTVDALRQGQIVAVKGLGGFHLVVDAGQEDAVARLRQRKKRYEKPLALMYPTLERLRRDCDPDPLEERLLQAPEAPIVLLRRRQGTSSVAPSVAPANPYLGAMLPYTPLHHLLLRPLQRPVVATSGNRSEEPICIDNAEAVQRLGDIADLLLVHDRPIRRQVDDSVARLIDGRQMLLRRARGYAPLPLPLTKRPKGPKEPPPALALGGQLKNTVALSLQNRAFVGQHIGDLGTRPALDAFRRVQQDLQDLYATTPRLIVHDLHPDYLSSQHARTVDLPRLAVQHHYAHVLACMADNEAASPVLGIAWDGSGYGPDGTVWGGEFLRVDADGYRRVGHLRLFPLPGGDEAVRQPRRAASGLLYALWGPAAFQQDDLAPLAAFSRAQRRILCRILERGLNAPQTSSAGRLFDAVAALAGIRQRSSFEGQAAIELEFAVDPQERAAYPFPYTADGLLDWGPLVEALIADVRAGVGTGRIAARFHNGLIEACLAVARAEGIERVALTGGCFQNKFLCQGLAQRLRAEGFCPLVHQRVPPNDGGIALGQLAAAARTIEENEHVSGHTG